MSSCRVGRIDPRIVRDQRILRPDGGVEELPGHDFLQRFREWVLRVVGPRLRRHAFAAEKQLPLEEERNRRRQVHEVDAIGVRGCYEARIARTECRSARFRITGHVAMGENPPAYAVPALDDAHVHARLLQSQRGVQPGQPRAHDQHLASGLRAQLPRRHRHAGGGACGGQQFATVQRVTGLVHGGCLDEGGAQYSGNGLRCHRRQPARI